MEGSNGSAGQSAIEAVPDALGKQTRVETVATMMRQIQTQLFNLEVNQVANGLEDSDAYPDNPRETVKERREFLHESQRRLMETFSTIMPDVRRALEQAVGKER